MKNYNNFPLWNYFIKPIFKAGYGATMMYKNSSGWLGLEASVGDLRWAQYKNTLVIVAIYLKPHSQVKKAMKLWAPWIHDMIVVSADHTNLPLKFSTMRWATHTHQGLQSLSSPSLNLIESCSETTRWRTVSTDDWNLFLGIWCSNTPILTSFVL